ncbi:MAG: hypothetical protein ABIQ16_03560 [Polyangiaceae bacterium]
MSCESYSYNKSYYDLVLNDPAALANVDLFGTHLYGTPVASYAYPLFDSKGTGKERWMTEHYTDSTADANSWPNALGVASEVHDAMVTGQFNAYIWWYIKRSYGFINNGAVTKRGDCIGHWSKFVRPGFYRVDATASPSAGLSLSAFKGGSSVVVVVVNTDSAAKSLSLSIPGSTIASFTKYTTSSSKSLANDGVVSASNGSLSVAFDASSVTTLVGSGGAGSGGAGSGGAGSGGAGSGGKSGSGGAGSGGAGFGGKSGSGGAAAIGGMSSNGGAAPIGGAFPEGGSIETGGGNSAGSGGFPTSAGGGAIAGAGNAFGTAGVSGAAGSTAPSAGGQGSIDESNPTDAGCTCRMGSREPKPKSFALLSLLGIFGLAWARRRTGRQS